LLETLAARMELVQQIGLLKKAKGLAVFQPARWDHVIERVHDLARNRGLSEQFLEDIFNRIHQESIRKQQ
jgi:chorismate mutase